MRQSKIKDILEKLLKINIGDNTNINLNDIDAYDSMNLVRIIIEIQNIDKKKIPLNKLNKISKISDLLEL